jgi:hypothetical protein
MQYDHIIPYIISKSIGTGTVSTVLLTISHVNAIRDLLVHVLGYIFMLTTLVLKIEGKVTFEI